MRYKLFYTLISILTLSFCKSPTAPGNASDVLQIISNDPLQDSSLPFLDTSITLSNVNDLGTHYGKVTEKEAEACLLKYFKQKGVIDRNYLKFSPLDDSDKICIDYDTIYQISTNKFSGAVISYWLGPCYLSGHCFQPAKSIILSTPKGMEIRNEGFIPTNFFIDSTIGSDIYGYDYDCGGKGTIRQFKLSLK